ncbi:hypothetical protein IWT140_02180 [Secundilactobacillus pentosiphilus]|uniref:Uncharacterized protein n=1 Tax=Secundilactobacillus pentosiphilus TaxID=1714682 RepID=A0A1Z5ISE2_9LACO|nr:hypothetical protein [Secundilactobacillus pentosiphilus]GAX04538.1 hypothetical protein IWT140_02180 [Secundilactobacillus pentosiphilus]
MELITAEKYLLITERIGKRPMLRTRFTSQAYFVVAVFLDLATNHVISLKDDRVTFNQSVQLPGYLSVFVKELTETLSQDDRLENALKPVTSWDIANQVYDGVGVKLLANHQVERVTFQNNLKPHTIYEPTDQARKAVSTWLMDQVTRSAEVSALNLFEILRQMTALKWVVPDEQQRQELMEKASQRSEDAGIQKITAAAADVITRKRFWLDSWLS